MLQFYFLSVLLNALAGLVFIYAEKKAEGTTKLISTSDGDDFGLNLDEFGDFPESDAVSDASSTESDGDGDGSGFDFDGEIGQDEKDVRKSFVREMPFLSDSAFKLVLGVLMALVGLMKLLSPIQYDIAIVGDLIPALAGLCGGASLLLEFYSSRSSVEFQLPSVLETIFVTSRNYLGIFCIISAVLHFIFPRVLFL